MVRPGEKAGGRSEGAPGAFPRAGLRNIMDRRSQLSQPDPESVRPRFPPKGGGELVNLEGSGIENGADIYYMRCSPSAATSSTASPHSVDPRQQAGGSRPPAPRLRFSSRVSVTRAAKRSRSHGGYLLRVAHAGD